MEEMERSKAKKGGQRGSEGRREGEKLKEEEEIGRSTGRRTER